MNMTPEIKTALEKVETMFIQGQKEMTDKLEDLGKDSGYAKDGLVKLQADLEAKHAEYDKQIKEVKAAALVSGPQGSPEDQARIQLKKEELVVRAWMRKSAAGNSVDLNKLFNSYGALRKNTAGLEQFLAEHKDLSVGNGPEAGFAVMPQMEQMITASLTERSMFRQLAQVITLGNSDCIERLVNKKGGVGASRDNETESTSRDDTGNPSLGDQKIFANYMRADVQVTQQLLDDAAFSIEQWIRTEADDDFLTREDTEWFLGRGPGRNVNEARGILTYPAGTNYGQIEQVNSGAAGAFTTDGLLDLQGSLKFGYRTGAAFFAQRAVIYGQLLTLKDAENRHYLVPDFANGFNFRLLGDAVYDAPAMPSAAADSLSLAYGNFQRGYTIVDRQGLEVMRDPYTAHPKVRFRFGKRTGGDVAVFEAIKLQKLAV